MTEWRHSCHWMLIMAISVSYAISYVFAVPVMDTSRDLAQAWLIASQGHRPLVGPQINQMIHVGPVWFYLLALPLSLTRSLTVVALFVGGLAALKFPLAYGCGRLLSDRKLGLCWVILLLLPGFHLFEQMTFLHVNLVATTSLWTLYSALRFRQGGSPAWFIQSLLAQSLALHAHPTTLVLIPVVVVLLLQGWRQHRLSVFTLAVGIMIAGTPWIPWLVDQTRNTAEMGSTLSYVAGLEWGDVLRTHELLWGIIGHGPLVVGRYVIGAGTLLPAYLTAVALVGVCCLLGIARSWSDVAHRHRVIAFSVVLVISVAVISLLRDETWFYMTLVISPMIAGVAAAGLSQLKKGLRVTALAAVIGLWAWTSIDIALHNSRNGLRALPIATLADVRVHPGEPLFETAAIPIYADEQLGKFLCNHLPLTVHGDLAKLLEANWGLSVAIACQGTDRVLLTGEFNDHPHLAGIIPPMPRPADLPATARFGPLLIVPVTQVFAPSTGRPIPDMARYPPVDWVKNRPALTTIQFRTRDPGILAITNAHRFFNLAAIRSVTVAGDELMPFAEGAATGLYRCPACGNQRQPWRIAVWTNDAEAIDVFALAPMSPHQQRSDPE